MSNIDFYFSIGSTYTYLSVTRILDVEKTSSKIQLETFFRESDNEGNE